MRSKSVERKTALRICFFAGPAFLIAGLQPVMAGCLISPAKFSDAVMRAFQDRPTDLLRRHPTGGPLMSAEVMRHVGSDDSVLASLIQLAKDGNLGQRVAIGIGLAKAASICSREHPELEQKIKEAVAAAGISELVTAFAVGTNSLVAAAETVSGAPDGGAAPLASGPRAAIGGNGPSSTIGGGGAAATFVGTELLTFGVQESVLSVRRGGQPAMSLKSDLTFSGRGVTSTSGATVSPTRQ